MLSLYFPLFLAQHELRSWVGSARIVTSVHLGMAIQTGTSLRDVGGAFAEAVRGRRLVAGYLAADNLWNEAAVRGMTLMTQERCTNLQHTFGNSAVRVMAVTAIFADGFVVMHERTAFFGMALVASINHCIALHQFWSDRAVRVMAIRAGNFTFQNRVMRRAVDLGALFFVAGEANFELCCFTKDFILGSVQCVAAGAADIAAFVGATSPM